MKILSVVSEGSGLEIGQVELTDAGDVHTRGSVAAGIFRQQKRRLGGADVEVFDALATGWSNGYVTIRALT